MWTRVRDDKGRRVEGDAFWKLLRGEHQVTTKVELLDTDFRVEDIIYSSDRSNEVTNFISDGSIDVDKTRGTRRTAELTLLNPTSDFTPTMKDDDWDGKLYLNRMIRIWRGVYYGRSPLYVPCGTFMTDNIDVLVEQNMSLVNLTLSDRWKMLTKSFFGNNKTYEKGTYYNTIIRDLLEGAGIVGVSEVDNLDKLSTRTEADKKTNAKIQFKIGDSRGDKLKELCDRWDIDAYFDPMGKFVTEDRLDPEDRDVVWRFYSGPIEDGRNGRLVSLRRSFNDDNLYNHVIVIGTGGQDGEEKKKVWRAERRNTDKKSVTNIDRIGDRVKLIQSDRIGSDTEAERTLNRAWKMRLQLSESVEIQAISNPALEADDMIRITETEHARLDDTFRIQRFNIPLVSSLQTIQAVNIIRW